MLKVVICCGAGMSSSYLTQRLQNEAKAKGLENEVSFDFFSLEAGIVEATKVLPNYDVAMCCPHLNHVIKDFVKNNTVDCALYIFPPQMYGTLIFDEVYQEAKDVHEEWLKSGKVNPFRWPGEDNPLKIRRSVAYRNLKK